MTNDKPRLRIEIPTTRRGIDNREAYRKFVAEGDKKKSLKLQQPSHLNLEIRCSCTRLCSHSPTWKNNFKV